MRKPKWNKELIKEMTPEEIEEILDLAFDAAMGCSILSKDLMKVMLGVKDFKDDALKELTETAASKLLKYAVVFAKYEKNEAREVQHDEPRIV